MPQTPADITPELRNWIVEQARAGCRPEAVLEAMRASGWDEAVAIRALEETLTDALVSPSGNPIAGSALMQPVPPSDAMPAFQAEARHNVVAIDGRDVEVVLALKTPRIVLFAGFLSDAECDGLIELARQRLARSETVDTRTGGNEVNSARTSEGMFFQRGENAICTVIESRIASLLNWPVENGEGLQVLRYGAGAEYLPHYDYFDPTQPGSGPVLRRGGQRVATVVMYLNTPGQGGATTFPDIGLTIAPVRGSAVFFSYDRPHPSTRTLHGGAPVVVGEKWVATKWLRQARFD